MEPKERSLEEIFGSYIGGGGREKERRVPFKFLDPYEAEDRDIFFGREEEKRELYRKYFASNLLLLYGESGTGKTSLLRCGLLTQIPSSDVLLIHLKNSAHPFEALKDALRGILEDSFDDKLSLLDNFRKLYKLKRKPLSILFDQFEEAFIFQPEEARREMIAQVKCWLESDLDIKVMFVIREEYLAKLTEFEETFHDLFRNKVWLKRMDIAQAKDAIVGPLEVCGVGIEKDLEQKLLSHLQRETKGVDLPDLQVLMDRLYEKAVERDSANPVLILKDYEVLGEMENILAAFLEEQVSKLPDPEVGKNLLKQMVTAEGTKKSASLEALSNQPNLSADEAASLLEKLEKARIVKRKRENEWELRHDALAKTIYSWMSETEKEIIEIRQLIGNRYIEYQKRKTLLDKESIELIAPYKAKLGLSADQKEFIRASETALKRRITRRRILIAVVLSAVILTLSGFTYWNFEERKKTQARYLYSQALLNADNEKASAYLAEALRTSTLGESINVANVVVSKMEGQFQIPRQALRRHESGVVRVAFSPDGSLLASSSYDKTIRLWNFRTGQERVLQGHAGLVWDLAFSPDGALLASASSDDKTVRLWDVWTGAAKVLKGHESTVHRVAFSPDGTLLASTSSDKTVRLWNVRTGEARVFKGHEGPTSAVAFSPDGKTIASASRDKTVRVWDIRTAEARVLKGHEDRVTDVGYFPDGTRLASASKDKTIRLWDVITAGAQILKGQEGGEVFSMALSPDGTFIAGASDDKAVRLWNVRTGEVRILKGHEDVPFSVRFSPDGTLLASASQDRTIRLWDIRTGEARVLKGHEGNVWAVAFSPDSRLLASGSLDKTVRLWNIRVKDTEVLKGHEDHVRSVAFSPDGKQVASASGDRTVRLWDIRTGQAQVFSGHEGLVWAVAFSPDGTHLASASSDKSVRLWDIRTGMARLLKGHQDAVSAVAFSPDGTLLASASFDKTIRLWTIQTETVRVLEGHTDAILDVAFSPDGKTLASASQDKSVRLWNIRTGESRVFRGHELPVWAVSFSPDGSLLASASFDKTLRLWKVQTGEARILKGHEHFVDGVAFSPDGNLIASASWDKTVRLWNIRTEEVRVLTGHEDQVRDVAFSPDGTLLASASLDKTVRLWNPLPKCYFPERKEPVWLFTAALTKDEILFALDAFANLRYDPKSDSVQPLPFKGIPKEWLQ